MMRCMPTCRGRRGHLLSGDGVPFLRALKALDGIKAANDDQQSGFDVVRRALRPGRSPRMPVRTVPGSSTSWSNPRTIIGASTRPPADIRTLSRQARSTRPSLCARRSRMRPRLHRP